VKTKLDERARVVFGMRLIVGAAVAILVLAGVLALRVLRDDLRAIGVDGGQLDSMLQKQGLWLVLAVLLGVLASVGLARLAGRKWRAEQNLARTAEQLTIAEERQRLLFDLTSEAIIVCDQDNRIEAVNRAFTRITGYSPQEVIGRDPKILQSGRHEPEFFQTMWQNLREHGSWEGEIWNRRKNGEAYPEWLAMTAIHDRHGRLTEYVAVYSDLTMRKREEERVRWQANFDPLTQLPNHKHFCECVNQSLERAQAVGGRAVLLFLDLGQFNEIDDRLGQQVGDKLLQMAAKRLRHAVRETDVVGRLRNQEFSVVLSDLAQLADWRPVCHRIVHSLGLPFHCDSHVLSVVVNIGVAVFPDDGKGPADLLKSAGNSLAKAKETGHPICRLAEISGT